MHFDYLADELSLTHVHNVKHIGASHALGNHKRTGDLEDFSFYYFHIDLCLSLHLCRHPGSSEDIASHGALHPLVKRLHTETAVGSGGGNRQNCRGRGIVKF